MTLVCRSCGSSSVTELNTYKRYWYFCHACGNAHPSQKSKYALTFLPEKMLKKIDATEASVYDYFIQPDHIAYSIDTAKDFLETHIYPNQIVFQGKSILDISGGNGHFIMEISKLSAKVALTEINDLALEYVRKTHGIDAYKFDFNRDRLPEIVNIKFDCILARAAIMFCSDLDQFVADARNCLVPDGLVVINHSVIPTLGVVVRVQLDEFSYYVLRQPANVVNAFEQHGFELLKRADETDPQMYVYANDVNNYWQLTHYLYEIPGVRRLMSAENQGKAGFSFRARDRRRSTLIFRRKG